jgi:hypothetical protein
MLPFIRFLGIVALTWNIAWGDTLTNGGQRWRVRLRFCRGESAQFGIVPRVQPPLFFSLVSCSYEETFTVEKYQGVMVKHVPESTTTTGDSVKKSACLRFKGEWRFNYAATGASSQLVRWNGGK